MNEEPLIPKALQNAFNRFSKLQSKQEKSEFWDELAKSSVGIPQDILGQQVKEGVSRLLEKVTVLHQKIKSKIPV
jgi:hypothetical protein